ncbi:MAG: copper amine oxidase N-terminal domain-containing protein [Tissierellia bacterium]|nr:copper amine oxidase N-terminal domain-containing protein [Tissierellia bacterium]
MKRIVFVLSLVLLLALSSVTAFADDVIINIDSTEVEFNEELGFPFIDENNRTQVPFRAALEKYGAEVDWDNESRAAIAVKGEMVVKVPIGENYILKNDEEIPVDTAARIVNGRTFLPIRAVIEAFGSEVQWDAALNTVVITTEPVDAKALYFAANEKSYDWDNYDIDAKINMEFPDDAGSAQSLEMNMNMTIFMEPLKAKVSASMLIPGMESLGLQQIVDMYMTLDEESITQYMSMPGETGEPSWVKQTIAIEMLTDLMKNDEETIAKNKELAKKYTEDVKYFGKYTEDGKTLLRLQFTMSGDIYKEIFADISDVMPETATEEEAMAVEMLEGLATMDIGDLTYIVYIDEATGEMVKMEMDLADMIVSMMSGMTEMLGVPAEEMEVLKSLKAVMTMEILNINSAEDFEIPEEALNAPEMSEMFKTETGLEVEVETEEEL